jgi:hypothetical protein
VLTTPLRCTQDFDGSDVGQFVSHAVIASGGIPTMMTWRAIPANLFPNGAQDIEHALVQNQAWAVIASMLFYDVTSLI